VLRVGGPASVAAFAVFSAGSAFAETGEVRQAAVAAGRDLVAADLVEGAFRVTVVQGAHVVGDYLIDPEGVVRRKYAEVSTEQLQELLEGVKDAQSLEYRDVVERANERKFGELLKGWWDSFDGQLRKGAE